MTSRTALVVTTVVLAVVLAVLVAVLTPWRPLPLHGVTPVPTDPERDFSAAQIARENAYHSAVRPPAYVSMLVSLLLAAALGFTSLGARIIQRVAEPLGGGWAWQVLLGTLALSLIGRLLVLPWDAWSESVRRDYGLSTRSWGGWLSDVAKGYGIGLVLTLVVLFLIIGLARWSPEWWWTVGAAVAAMLVVLVSFAYPVVVEPVFNKFTSMPSGELRTSLLDLAREDGVPVEDVLVADASRRTSSLNAYVSGFGSTRRIVVYDTLLDSASDREIELIVAHELGHAKSKDVLWGTLMGAVGVALLVCVLALLTRWTWLLGRAGVPSLGDGRAVALVLALVAVIGFVAGPAQNLISRRIETRADVHALDLTHAPEAAITMQRRLSTRNLSDLDPSPLVFGMFASHPTGPQRIALARTWERVRAAAR
ncbi:MAG TPA: M48 family metallopeptidase [Actinomycetes bacterium]|nr:M48 family metallopeptidase [Actinomycetes bacterium]